MTNEAQLDALEAALLQLGQLELSTEATLERLSVNARAYLASGDTDTADALWEQYDRISLRLKSLKTKIYDVENQLYAKRRRFRQ